MSNIECECGDCIFNEDGFCTKGYISINENIMCDDFYEGDEEDFD